jgi:NitT/TauT family transport system permease protein
MSAVAVQHRAVPTLPVWLRPLLGLAVLLLVWQAVVLTGRIPEDYLPGVPAIAQALWEELTSGEFWMHEGLTVLRAVCGLLLAVASGIGAALLGARYRVVRRALSPLTQIMLSLPPAALVPLSIFALGLGLPLFLFIIWFACVWTIYAAADHALATSEPVQLHAARSLGHGAWAVLWQVRLPAALPQIASGVRIAAAGSLMAAVAAEMLAGKDGLGFLLYDSAFSLRIPEMFALLAVTGVDGVLLNAAILRLRRHFAGWHDSLAAQAEH